MAHAATRGLMAARAVRSARHALQAPPARALARWRGSWPGDLQQTRRSAAVATCTLNEVLEASEQQAEVNESEGLPEMNIHADDHTQGVLWFANIYPTKAFRFDIRQAFTHHNHETLIPQLLPEGVEVLRMVPREREGGAFVVFRAPPAFVAKVLVNMASKESMQPTIRATPAKDEDIPIKVSRGISQYLKTHNVRAFLCPHPVRAHRVEGDPYLEDLQARYPGSKLQIKVDPPGSASEERIYSMLRRYGVLDDIEALPDGKGYVASFRYAAAAVAARNCLHRATLEARIASEAKAKLKIEYVPFMRKWLRETIVQNARYTIPLIVFCMLGTTYFIWDPLRIFSAQLRIAGVVLDSESDARQPHEHGHQLLPGGPWGVFLQFWQQWRRVEDQVLASTFFNQRSKQLSLLQDFWADRGEEAGELRRWLTEPHDQVMLLTGHRGNGQGDFVKEVLGIHAVYVDVSEVLEAGGSADDQVFLRGLCRALGYWPPQGMDRQMSALLDMMLPGSAKLSRENEMMVAMQRILSAVTMALSVWKQRIRRTRPDECADFHPHGNNEATEPLFVIRGFTAENKDRRPGFFDALVTWAAYVAEARLARVVFIADSSFGEQAILAGLQNRPDRLVKAEMQDASQHSIRSIIERHFRSKVDISDQSLAVVGGRFRDIAALVDRIKQGDDPEVALRRLIEAAETVVNTLLISGQPNAKWTRPQLWRACRILSKAGPGQGVPYDVFLWQVFRGDEEALRSMKESNLILVAPRGGRSLEGGETKNLEVLPGSPLFAEVYRRLVAQEGMAAVMDLEVAKEDVKREAKTLDGYEAELVRLQEVDDVRREKGRGLADPNLALRKRKEQLLELILEQHNKLKKYHKARRDAMAAISRNNDDFVAAARAGKDAPAAQVTSRRPSLLTWPFRVVGLM